MENNENNENNEHEIGLVTNKNKRYASAIPTTKEAAKMSEVESLIERILSHLRHMHPGELRRVLRYVERECFKRTEWRLSTVP